MTFFNYGAPMFRFAATICAREASRDAFDAHGTAMDDNIDEKQLVYKYINVILTVFPRPAMTWNMFFWMMELVTEFIRDYDPMAFDFEASVLGVVGVAASGNMTALPDV